MNSLKETINEVICRVLEETAFFFPEPTDVIEGVDYDSLDMVEVSVSYTGSQSGRVILLLSADFCRELSANMLGEDNDENDSSEAYYDAAKELVNITAGQLMTALHGTKAVFNLSPPDIRTLTSEDLFATLERHECVCCMADEHPVIAILTEGTSQDEHQSSGS